MFKCRLAGTSGEGARKTGHKEQITEALKLLGTWEGMRLGAQVARVWPFLCWEEREEAEGHRGAAQFGGFGLSTCGHSCSELK